jgi:hypothetical protein
MSYRTHPNLSSRGGVRYVSLCARSSYLDSERASSSKSFPLRERPMFTLDLAWLFRTFQFPSRVRQELTQACRPAGATGVCSEVAGRGAASSDEFCRFNTIIFRSEFFLVALLMWISENPRLCSSLEFDVSEDGIFVHCVIDSVTTLSWR